ncbi:MAG: toxin-antitoxin system HicB family antitoxin, partial [Gammaproteobacteria bacterium]
MRSAKTGSSAPWEPASGKLMLRVDPAIHAAAIKAAKRERLSLNQGAGRVLAEVANAGHSGPRPVAGTV